MEAENNENASRLPLPTTTKCLKAMSAEQQMRAYNQFSFIPRATKSDATDSALTSRSTANTVSKIGRARVGPMASSMSVMARLRPYPMASVNACHSSQQSARLNFDAPSVASKSSPSLLSHSPNKNDDSKVSAKSLSPSIDWNAITREAEMVKIKARVSQLEDMLEVSNVNNSQLKVDYDMKIEKLSLELSREKESTTDLNKQIKFNEKRLDDLSVQLSTAREEFALEYDRYQKKVNELQKQNNALIVELSDTKMEKQSMEVKHESNLMECQHKIAILHSDIVNYTHEMDIMKKQKQELLTHAKDGELLSTQLNESKLEIKRLEQEIILYKDGIKLSDILRNELEELKTYREENKNLKRENYMLNDVNSKNMILEEKKISLETQLNNALNTINSTVAMDVECNSLKSRLAQWEEVMATDSPIRVSSHIAELQKNEIALRSELGALKSELNDLLSSKAQIESSLRSDQSGNNDLQRKISEQSETIKKLNRKCLLFSKERENYKRLISSYEHDVTIDINKVSQERITALESIIDEYKIMVQQLESELKGVKEQNQSQNKPDDSSEINALKDELTTLRSLYSQMENMNKSDHRNDFRVIHFNSNPLSQNIEEQFEANRKLVEENRKLTAKLELLESGNDQNISRQLEDGIKSALEVENLKQKLTSAEKQQKNIIEAFKKTSKEFREVCYILTGYRIDALKQNLYRLSHVYAESPNDNLLFGWETDRTIKLLETNYSEKLTDLVQTYLTQHDSFPAFLASLTLDLFGKQTHFVNTTNR